jgi:hypothetical protein
MPPWSTLVTTMIFIIVVTMMTPVVMILTVVTLHNSILFFVYISIWAPMDLAELAKLYSAFYSELLCRLMVEAQIFN